ncbi:MAG: hypothetical protein Q4A78_04860 [Peptostreptococcaceae bacterium]|nr:hypothetical protein [Peptostreptococcaceae bacterium]
MTAQKIRAIAFRIYWVIAIYWLNSRLDGSERCPILRKFYDSFYSKWIPPWTDHHFFLPFYMGTFLMQIVYYRVVMGILCFVFVNNLIRIRKSRLNGKTPSGLYYVDCVLSAVHLIWIFVICVLCRPPYSV